MIIDVDEIRKEVEEYEALGSPASGSLNEYVKSLFRKNIEIQGFIWLRTLLNAINKKDQMLREIYNVIEFPDRNTLGSGRVFQDGEIYTWSIRDELLNNIAQALGKKK